MDFCLHPDIRFCFPDQGLAFVDLRSDRYFSLQGPAEAAFKLFASGAPLDRDAVCALEPLLAAAVLMPSDRRACGRPVEVTQALRSAGDLRRPSIGVGDALTSIGCYHLARHEVERQSLKAILDRISRCFRNGALPPWPREPSPAAELAAVYVNIRPFVRVQDKCLVWSLGMQKFLAAKGIRANLVIGVKLEPFAAHAWLQSAGMVLSCPLEEARLYTPLLVA